MENDELLREIRALKARVEALELRPGYDPAFFIQTGGSIIALRCVVAAIMKSHPEPERLLQALREIQALPGARDGEHPDPIQVAVDRIVAELTSHLVRRG